MSDPDLENAERGAQNARRRLADTLGDLQSRLSPKTLARGAIHDLRETGGDLARDGIEVARRHPLRLAAVVAGVGALLVRRPIARLFRRDATRDTYKS